MYVWFIAFDSHFSKERVYSRCVAKSIDLEDYKEEGRQALSEVPNILARMDSKDVPTL